MALQSGSEPTFPARYLCMKMQCAAPKSLLDEMHAEKNEENVHHFNTKQTENKENSHENKESDISHTRFRCIYRNQDIENQGCRYDMPCKASCFNAPPCMRATDRYAELPVYPGKLKTRRKVQCIHNYEFK